MIPHISVAFFPSMAPFFLLLSFSFLSAHVIINTKGSILKLQLETEMAEYRIAEEIFSGRSQRCLYVGQVELDAFLKGQSTSKGKTCQMLLLQVTMPAAALQFTDLNQETICFIVTTLKIPTCEPPVTLGRYGESEKDVSVFSCKSLDLSGPGNSVQSH